jgi:mono/diheme cytochrome c family protein
MKRRSKGAFILLVSLPFVICMAFTLPSPSLSGEQVYKQNCTRCHGNDGTKGLFGAKNLKRSTLQDSEIMQRLKSGKGIMPSFQKRLSPAEMQQVLVYIKHLREPLSKE